MKYFTLTFLMTLSSLWAQIPVGYYDNAAGLTGEDLQQALHDIIDGHQQQTYTALWTHFRTTDVRPNGSVWDMYSDIPGETPPYEFTFGDDQDTGSGGTSEGDVYNREHSWPKSWFGDGYPMYSDLFHLVPSDKYVNSQRSNYPYGEVNSPSWTSLNGSKRGPNTYPGYTGTVFEPIDAYKGDFARNYFYMSTRYFNEDGGWPGSAMVNGAQLETWALNMMLEWHAEDPVSDKELDRNDAIYNIQNNRNPYIDHPEYVGLLWGGETLGLPMPTDLQVYNITDSSVDFSWTDNASTEDGYYIYINGSRAATLDANSETYLAINLEASTRYVLSVSAFNTDEESNLASIAVNTTDGGGSTATHFTEGFEGWTGGDNEYVDGDFELESGIWNAFAAGNFTLGGAYTGNYCVALNDDTYGAQITTPAVNTLGNISFYYYQRSGSAADEFQVQKSVNGEAFVTIATQVYNVGESYTLFSLAVNDTSSYIKVRILNDNQVAHLIIDDITVTAYDPVSIDGGQTGIPIGLTLHSAYPNPFNPVTTISFTIPVETLYATSLQVFDVNGRFVEALHNGLTAPGIYTVKWEGENFPSGIYFMCLSSGGDVQIQRVTLLK